MGVIVAPIAFVSEHSETLVELDIDYRQLAAQAGVPCYVRVATVGDDAPSSPASRRWCAERKRGTARSAARRARLCPARLRPLSVRAMSGDSGVIALYPWLKALHILSVIAWMAGLLYLPRLFVYHADAPPGSEASETFKVMERRLLRGIMNPAMIAT